MSMHIPALIFARMDSSRLPGKALMPLAGQPVLGRVIRRLALADEIDGIVVCTSDRAVDDPIAAFAEVRKVGLFRGSAEDVLGRAAAAARSLNADAVVRISGDSPFIDPVLVDQLISAHRDIEPDLTTNVHPRTYPAGLSVEVLAMPTLQKLDQVVSEPADREHVTPYIYRHADDFRIRNVAAPEPLRDVDLALDTETDFTFQSWLAGEVADDAGLDKIIAAARRYPARLKEAAS
ncbi:MAG: NTP transferase domain-containing protein [Rhodospirillales bacterium]